MVTPAKAAHDHHAASATRQLVHLELHAVYPHLSLRPATSSQSGPSTSPRVVREDTQAKDGPRAIRHTQAKHYTAAKLHTRVQHHTRVKRRFGRQSAQRAATDRTRGHKVQGGGRRPNKWAAPEAERTRGRHLNAGHIAHKRGQHLKQSAHETGQEPEGGRQSQHREARRGDAEPASSGAIRRRSVAPPPWPPRPCHPAPPGVRQAL